MTLTTLMGRVPAGVLTLGLFLSACGGDDASSAETPTAPPATDVAASLKTEQDAPEGRPYDFDGVFDDTIAGTIDRTPLRRRPDGPPNIVLIIADDLGWPYLGFLGDENVLTPNMDILGRNGFVFETGHSSANHCRPTLQSLITGLYPQQYEAKAAAIADARMTSTPLPPGVDTARKREILHRQYETAAIEEFDTLPRLLATRGYASHQSGKWWEQSYAHGGFTHGMTGTWTWEDAADLGDRWFFTFMGGQGMEIGRTTMAPVTDFIETHAEEPFFLWYGPALPHVPLNPPYEFYKYFADRTDLSESAKLYYANIAWFDWGVGQLLDSLEANGVLDNTLIVYINDNGWEQAPDTEYADEDINFANGGPRGKGSFFDTAFRTPIIFYWADEISSGRDTRHLVNAIDVMPTLLDYAGIAPPNGLPGYSLRPLIEGDALAAPRQAMFGRMTRHRAGTDFRGKPIDTGDDHMGGDLAGFYRRDERWHFVWLPETNEMALYDLSTDPGQTQDVAAQNGDLTQQFIDEIRTWNAGVSDGVDAP